MAFSAGVPVALSYVISHPDHVKGSILLDYPAVSRALADGWAEQARPFAQNRGIPEHVIGSMIQESQTVELWDDAASISTPVLLIKGGRSNAITEEALSRYRQALPHLQLEIFDDSGHEVFQPDYERFMQTIERFLRRID
jgi:pimeloyl-ACP methyl ester carboxylesterase